MSDFDHVHEWDFFGYIFEIICNFIDLYPLYTIKRLDYLDWKQLINLKKVNAHLNKEGLDLMKKIKMNMNNKRIK